MSGNEYSSALSWATALSRFLTVCRVRVIPIAAAKALATAAARLGELALAVMVTKPVVASAVVETPLSNEAPRGCGRGSRLAAWLATEVVVINAAT